MSSNTGLPSTPHDSLQEKTFRSASIRNSVLLLLVLSYAALAQPTRSVASDVLVFVNGEQLTGTLTGATADSITFNSTMAGSITVPWAKIKTLTSTQRFAVIEKHLKLSREDALKIVPVGSVQADEKTLTVASSTGPRTESVADTSMLLNAAAFDKALRKTGLLQGWAGSVTAGASLVRATENSTTLIGGLALTRSTPGVTWIPDRRRSLLNYSQSYGTISQDGVLTSETNIFHANFERDEYFSSRLYAFGSLTFDHNFSSQLGLQQAYGGGVGVTAIRDGRQELDFKGDVHYEKQSFFDTVSGPTATLQDQNLFGSTFTENWLRHLSTKGLILTEFGSVSPAWHQTNSSAQQPNAYSAHVDGSLKFPVYKGFAFNVGAVDDFINNAPVGSKQNSTQFTTGITYTLRPR